MKTTKIIIIATIVTIMLICSVAYAMPAHAEELPEDFYTLDAVVIGWDQIGETERQIDCLAEDGNIWSFFDEKGEWEVGDTLFLVMWECTEDEEDDEVIDVIWTGYLEPEALGRFLWEHKW